jgi:hypothetical protein
MKKVEYFFRNPVWKTLSPEVEQKFLEGIAGTYRPSDEYVNSSERKERMSAIIGSMRSETDANYLKAEEERRLARLGVLELRRQRD